MPAEDLQPMPAPVAAALGCADVAFFQYACEEADYASYRVHCRTYPLDEGSDTLVTRLSPEDVTALEAAALRLLDRAPPECEASADSFREAVTAATSQRRRNGTTLRALEVLAAGTLDPGGCRVQGGARSFEDALRAALAAEQRPVLALEDVEVGCNELRGGSPSDDAQLAKQLAANWQDRQWAVSASQLYGGLPEVFSCGDLDNFTALEAATSNLPWLREGTLQGRNSALASSIESALDEHPGQVILAVLGIQHLPNVRSATGVLQQLREAGFAVAQLNQTFECAKSSNVAPSRKELGQCLAPVGRSQAASCEKFRAAFDKQLGKDPMLGRTKQSTDCASCLTGNVTCACTVQWENTAAFEELCRNFTVDNVSGKVYNLDLTRNPGSRRTGAEFAQKEVAGIYQKCYATSCDIELLEELESRIWYSEDATLSAGRVTIRDPTSRGFWWWWPRWAGFSWPTWLSWLLLALCLLGLVLLGAWAWLHFYGHLDSLGSKASKRKPRGSWKISPRPSPREPFQKGGAGTFARKAQDEDTGSSEEWEEGEEHGREGHRREVSEPSPGDFYDSSLLMQALQMKQHINEVGAHAVQQMTMSGLQGMHESALQSMHAMPTLPNSLLMSSPHGAGFEAAGPPSSWIVSPARYAMSPQHQMYTPLAMDDQAAAFPLHPQHSLQPGWGWQR